MSSSSRFAVILFSCILFTTSLSAQNLLNQPESVVFDPFNERYLVSNWGSGHLVQIDMDGNQEYYIQNQHCHAGLHIRGEILYVACRQYGVKMIDLLTDEIIFSLSLPEYGNLNDAVTDTSGYIYLSYPSESMLIRVNPETEEHEILLDEGITTPNGMYFEPENNRIVFVSYRGNSPIQAFNLTDSTLSTLRDTPLDNLDGITRDADGYYYVSSWATNRVYKLNPDLQGDIATFHTFDDDPADIAADTINHVLGVPLFFNHGIEFVPFHETTVQPEGDQSPLTFKIGPAYPNPFNSCISIPIQAESNSEIQLNLVNMTGQTVVQKRFAMNTYGAMIYSLDCTPYGSGCYILRIRSDQEERIQKVLFIR